MSLPAALRQQIKEEILGPDYELSVAFVSRTVIHKANLKYRGKDKPTNVLSFPFSASEGELLLCRAEMTEAELLPLFIHGLLHLKGLDHGSTMEAEEARLFKLFSPYVTPHRRRSRYRKHRHPAGGR